MYEIAFLTTLPASSLTSVATKSLLLEDNTVYWIDTDFVNRGKYIFLRRNRTLSVFRDNEEGQHQFHRATMIWLSLCATIHPTQSPRVALRRVLLSQNGRSTLSPHHIGIYSEIALSIGSKCVMLIYAMFKGVQVFQ